MNMIEKVARAIAFSEGARITGPGQSKATRELGWKGDGEHLEKYAERHWHDFVNEAGMAIEAMREPNEKMVDTDDDVLRGEHEDERDAIKRAYGLLWHFNSDGTPNSKIVTEARKLLRDVLVHDELSEGIKSAEETCRRVGAKFDPMIGGGWAPT